MATVTPTFHDETDALASLEERILRAVQLVSQLKKEKESLENDNLRLMEEVETLQNDRKAVRSRIEKLLGQIDQLAG